MGKKHTLKLAEMIRRRRINDPERHTFYLSGQTVKAFKALCGPDVSMSSLIEELMREAIAEDDEPTISRKKKK